MGGLISRAFSHVAIGVCLLGGVFLATTPVVVSAAKSALVRFQVGQAPHTIVVRDEDPGGIVATYDMWWHRVADSGVKVVIDGDCVSACALIMGIVPPERICMTARATFGLHMASSVGEDGKRAPNPDFTAWMIRRYYPLVVQEWIEAHGGLKEDIQYMKLVDFKGYYRQCKSEEYNPWPTES